MEILSQLGIKPILLLAQIINFFIILLLLTKFLYKPILKMLDERKNKIQTSIEQAKKIEEELKNAEKNKLDKEEEAKKIAEKILDDAKRSAELTRQNIINQSEEDANRIINKAKQEITSEKERILREVRKEAIEFTTLATEQVLKKGIDQQRQQELIQEAIQEIDKINLK